MLVCALSLLYKRFVVGLLKRKRKGRWFERRDSEVVLAGQYEEVERGFSHNGEQ